jgi:hypothetical protein
VPPQVRSQINVGSGKVTSQVKKPFHSQNFEKLALNRLDEANQNKAVYNYEPEIEPNKFRESMKKDEKGKVVKMVEDACRAGKRTSSKSVSAHSEMAQKNKEPNRLNEPHCRKQGTKNLLSCKGDEMLAYSKLVPAQRPNMGPESSPRRSQQAQP